MKKISILLLTVLLSVLLTACASKEDASFLMSENESYKNEQEEQRVSKEEDSDANEELASEETSVEDKSEHSVPQEAESCTVYVCGEVVNPGVYELTAGSRIYEAVEMAGGFLESASRDTMNMAELLTDGQMIHILSEEEAEEQIASGNIAASGETTAAQTAQAAEKSGLVNINTADRELLMTLTGIGESKADSIIAYRQEYGAFSRIEDVMQIAGIKEGVYEKIKNSITVD